MNQNGFSLFESLIALSLISTTCLLMLKQQWQAQQWSNQQILIWQANHHLSNACERAKAGFARQNLPPPFHWQPSGQLTITWQAYQKSNAHQLACSEPPLNRNRRLSEV